MSALDHSLNFTKLCCLLPTFLMSSRTPKICNNAAASWRAAWRSKTPIRFHTMTPAGRGCASLQMQFSDPNLQGSLANRGRQRTPLFVPALLCAASLGGAVFFRPSGDVSKYIFANATGCARHRVPQNHAGAALAGEPEGGYRGLVLDRGRHQRQRCPHTCALPASSRRFLTASVRAAGFRDHSPSCC